jgi:hypothetical protein
LLPPDYVTSTITSLSDLAAIATVGLTPPIIRCWILASGMTFQVWQLKSGSDATGPGVQRPNDFNLSTNAKVWYQAGL